MLTWEYTNRTPSEAITKKWRSVHSDKVLETNDCTNKTEMAVEQRRIHLASLVLPIFIVQGNTMLYFHLYSVLFFYFFLFLQHQAVVSCKVVNTLLK